MKNVPSNLSNLKSKIDKLDVDKLVPVPVELKKDVYNAKIKDIEYKIPDITNLATSTTVWKVSKHGAFSGPYFPVFGMNNEYYRKLWTRIFVFGHFHDVYYT